MDNLPDIYRSRARRTPRKFIPDGPDELQSWPKVAEYCPNTADQLTGWGADCPGPERANLATSNIAVCSDVRPNPSRVNRAGISHQRDPTPLRHHIPPFDISDFSASPPSSESTSANVRRHMSKHCPGNRGWVQVRPKLAGSGLGHSLTCVGQKLRMGLGEHVISGHFRRSIDC